ncbi:hypothetical protein [endosymbiont GvMRE of Glomus versiforme]|uniref:hypothetical protein n=1 Tax=endosymbiont GvMRE of Glomus versiforme TaxID=2039283 RepID=UPI000EBEAC57|nr:hypothetical protein [endosymbiont GvMRE of Glomus versiforme]RHZ37470.1 hypothetical protein GvMRE_I1g386 [endosymbiont GvMRE of Glomus versiforme]
MNKIIKVNNQAVEETLRTIESDKEHYPELWEKISGEKLSKEKDAKLKLVGNLEFVNLKKVESPKLLTELSERINRGEIRLSVFDCCYLMRCFSFIRQQIEETEKSKEKENKQPISQIPVSNLDMLTITMLHLLKRDHLLCPDHSKFMEKIDKKEVETSKKEE